MLATQTLEVIGLRRRDDDTVTVELGTPRGAAAPDLIPMQIPLGTHLVDVPAASTPALGAAVTVTFALQA